ncbi:hypothetical protein GCM10020001_003600 [Nonomuraea salmonea]
MARSAISATTTVRGAGALDEAVLLQAAQRLAHGGGADREPLGQAALGHLLAGAQRAAADRLAQGLVGVVGPRLGTGGRVDLHAITLTSLWQNQMPSLTFFCYSKSS